ncbi:hypothetical protein HUN08_12845 [Gordonia sp. X0973]|uniref:hypothetical protein n=1 Tax=Gordonia sp. X0973 TaxID=2742602 RepID=UPI000F548F1B|nr:hypothetical protein [Gordonia sp. X0973]QKT07972.1 hypothetical protein HUN08_12845 [Gordonia sp. X0973]
MAYNEGPFGMDPDDFDRFTREAGDSLKGLFSKFLENQGSSFSSAFSTATRSPRREPETAGEAGNGVWAIIARDGESARVEQVFPTEIEALRANQHNTDDHRRVRFLPYGIAISALDD